MIRTTIFTLLLVMGTVTLLPAQGRQADPGPVETLLEMRESLALTATQVASLERIDAAMDTQNRPLVRQLSAIRRQIRALGPRSEMSTEQRARFEAHLEEARPLMRQIEQNNRSAMKQVGRLLTKEQKDQVEEVLRERTDRRRNDDSRRGSRNSRPGDDL